MKIRALTAFAVLVISTTACTPQEIQFWRAFHQQHPAEAEELLSELGAPSAAIRHPGLTITAGSQRFAAEATCAGTLTVTNRSGTAFTYAAVYGPTQTPLVAMQADS